MHRLGGCCSDCPWFPPPSTTTIRALGSSLCATWAPRYGVAASSDPWIIRIGGSPAPLTASGCAAPCTGQNAQAALNHALSQASNGAVRYTRRVSASHSAQLRGQPTSLHSTALYTANSFSFCPPSALYSLSSPLADPVCR